MVQPISVFSCLSLADITKTFLFYEKTIFDSLRSYTLP